MKSINETLRAAIRERNSLVCVGLDVHPDRMPAPLKKDIDSILAFNRAIIDATADLVVAYKPNLAFYEALGSAGWDILRKTVEYIPKGIMTIGDAKRGDIGTTAERYAVALYDLGFDWITVSPYLGWDSIGPFVKDPAKGAFILCLTSNPSSKDFQYLESGGKTLYAHVAETASRWNELSNCGLVVGATHPEELALVRSLAPDLPFLIPGIGAQGGDLEAAIINGTDAHGEQAIINSSRGIIYKSSGDDFADAARHEAQKLRDAINLVRVKKQDQMAQ
ncbi:orotidine-5'-phosphate decarboxylase [bacterium]|nr:orotidine-5'-phosphate decarboxylase [bacterium]